ncbi:FMRF-Like Peptide [Caenorhabditis elegans]|nr:FMRF-Like Peptide [Caenorhabditis elegans]CZR14493.1 FMRF-Like Peptide [Caenorhabditis elegans]|eukprot:NP_001309577.1 Uncharacterized protein CELE_R06F6.14 [Caenorhabditis elegans]
MRSLLIFVFFATIFAVDAQYDSADSSQSEDLPDIAPESVSSEEIIEVDVNIEGSGSGDGPIIDQVHMFGILPGPGDIRKKRGILEILGRK